MGRSKTQLFSSFVDLSSSFITIKTEEKEITSSASSSFVAMKDMAMEKEKKAIFSFSLFLTKKETTAFSEEEISFS